MEDDAISVEQQEASEDARARTSQDPYTAAPPAAVYITYYTDPLCSWSWAFEPQWRRLRYEFADQLHWTNRMGGLIANWQQYSDPLNDISRPVQMGPQWFQVRTLSGMPIEERIWFEDPPTSSYPACIAVKAAERQGRTLGEIYLRRLREAVMIERRNIARREVLFDLARELCALQKAFDFSQFERDLDNPTTVEAFRSDLQDARYREIGRFPTLIITAPSGPGILIVGYRPYAVLRKALMHIAPALQAVRQQRTVVEYATFWGRVTVREVAEAFDLEIAAAAQALEAAVATGDLIEQGVFFCATPCPAEQAPACRDHG